MYCSFCGVELPNKFPSVICNDCFIVKHKDIVKKNPEVSGITSGVPGPSGVPGSSGSSGIPISYIFYSERAGTEKKRLTSKWRMLRFNKPKRMIR